MEDLSFNRLEIPVIAEELDGKKLFLYHCDHGKCCFVGNDMLADSIGRAARSYCWAGLPSACLGLMAG